MVIRASRIHQRHPSNHHNELNHKNYNTDATRRPQQRGSLIREPQVVVCHTCSFVDGYSHGGLGAQPNPNSLGFQPPASVSVAFVVVAESVSAWKMVQLAAGLHGYEATTSMMVTICQLSWFLHPGDLYRMPMNGKSHESPRWLILKDEWLRSHKDEFIADNYFPWFVLVDAAYQLLRHEQLALSRPHGTDSNHRQLLSARPSLLK